ncbi:hypothetical protein ACFU7T_14350 [Streptomyces sp. NPDC057555]|uniref:hypothetical protein n=1 Tax=Streptomyces sp. NPDC057555 TaxID=3346166 RepID=UPI00369945C0
MDDDTSAVTQAAPQWQAERLRERAADAFTEVQRADTKATALCGVAGGLLAVDVAVLSQVDSGSWLLLSGLALMSVLLGIATSAALWAIRPVMPKGGLCAELTVGTDARAAETFVTAATTVDLDTERCVATRRLRMLAALADRKLRAVRVAVDLILAALILAGMGLLITCVAS